MGYIVYTSVGSDTFTQKSFESVSELAKWALTEALDKPSPPAEEVSAPSTIKPVTVEPVDILQLLSNPMTKPTSKWDTDTDKWFDTESASPWKEMLKKRQWPGAARSYYRFLHEKCWKDAIPRDALPREIVRFFYTLCKKYPVRVMEELDGDTEVHWDELPREFWAECDKEFSLSFDGLLSPIQAMHPLLIQIAQIYNSFLTASQCRHWSGKTTGVAGIPWGNAKQMMEYFVHEWWSGNKASDEIHTFMIKMVVGRNYYVEHAEEKTIGASEFMEDYKRLVKELDLPEEFVAWATKGTQHRHCKKALEDLGIMQVRRAEGQRYVGIRLLINSEPACLPMDFATDNTIMQYEAIGLTPYDVYTSFLPEQFGVV